MVEDTRWRLDRESLFSMTNLLGNFCLIVISFGRFIRFRGGWGGVLVLISHLASFLIRVVSFNRAAPLAISVLLGAAAAAAAATTAGAAAATVLTTIACTGTARASTAAAAQAARVAAGIACR